MMRRSRLSFLGLASASESAGSAAWSARAVANSRKRTESFTFMVQIAGNGFSVCSELAQDAVEHPIDGGGRNAGALADA